MAGLTETKANSAFKLSLNLGLAWAELGNMLRLISEKRRFKSPLSMIDQQQEVSSNETDLQMLISWEICRAGGVGSDRKGTYLCRIHFIFLCLKEQFSNRGCLLGIPHLVN